MSKRILILVVSSLDPPYGQMINTSLKTWDSAEVENCETVYYYGRPATQGSDRFNKEKEIRIGVEETYSNMGHKMLQAFAYGLKKVNFDYIVRINSSCYCDKKQLAKYIETLPDTNVFAGVRIKAGAEYSKDWCWGGGQFVLSKDVVQKVVENKHLFNHNYIEDVALSHLVGDLGVEFTEGVACSINKQENGWLLLTYGGGEQKEFKDFLELKDCGQHFYRVKHDPDRTVDAYVMNELYNVLK